MNHEKPEPLHHIIHNNTGNHKYGCIGYICYGFSDIDELSAYESKIMEICSGCNDG